jgi:general stress protein YciG
MTTFDPDARPRPRRGFAGMDAERRREIARLGGRAAHELGRAHEFTPEEAREARARSLRPPGLDDAPPVP